MDRIMRRCGVGLCPDPRSSSTISDSQLNLWLLQLYAVALYSDMPSPVKKTSGLRSMNGGS